MSDEIDTVKTQKAEGFSYVFGVSDNIVLPGDCTNRGGERRRVGGVVTTRLVAIQAVFTGQNETLCQVRPQIPPHHPALMTAFGLNEAELEPCCPKNHHL